MLNRLQSLVGVCLITFTGESISAAVSYHKHGQYILIKVGPPYNLLGLQWLGNGLQCQHSQPALGYLPLRLC